MQSWIRGARVLIYVFTRYFPCLHISFTITRSTLPCVRMSIFILFYFLFIFFFNRRFIPCLLIFFNYLFNIAPTVYMALGTLLHFITQVYLVIKEKNRHKEKQITITLPVRRVEQFGFLLTLITLHLSNCT